MKKQVVDLSEVKKTSTGFNHVVRAGGLIFLSSQLSADLKTGEIIEGDVQQQTKQAMDNIKHLLDQVGCEMDDIIKVVIYFKNPKDRHQINEVYTQYFSKGQEPAKVSVQAASPIKGVDVEIEAIAVISENS